MGWWVAAVSQGRKCIYAPSGKKSLYGYVQARDKTLPGTGSIYFVLEYQVLYLTNCETLKHRFMRALLGKFACAGRCTAAGTMPQCSVRAWCLVLYAAVYRVPGISCQVPRCSTLGEGRGNRQKLKNSQRPAPPSVDRRWNIWSYVQQQ